MNHGYRVAALCAILGVALAGCLEDRREYVLDHDGSGMVSVQIRQPLATSADGAAGQKELARKAVSMILFQSRGVRAWEKVSYEVEGGNTLHFKGTAYFWDINKLFIESAFLSPCLGVSWQEENGIAALDVRCVDPVERDGPPLSEGEINEKAATLKARCRQWLSMARDAGDRLRIEWSFALLQKPTTLSNLQPVDGDPKSIKFVYNGAQASEALNKLLADDGYWRRQAAAHADADGLQGVRRASELLLETLGPVRATFDRLVYGRRTSGGSEAETNQADMLVRLDLGDERDYIPPAQGDAFKRLKIVCARLVTESDSSRDMRPFGQEKGLGLLFFGEFTGSVLGVSSGELVSAVADNGEELLQAGESYRKVEIGELTNGRTDLTFGCQLPLPPAGVRGLKQISGRIHCTVARGYKDVDLGVMALKPDAKGNALGARVIGARKSPLGACPFELDLSLTADGRMIRRVMLLDGANEAAKTATLCRDDGGCRCFLSRKAPFPAEARIVVRLHDDLQTLVVPFKVSGVDLLGRRVAIPREGAQR